MSAESASAIAVDLGAAEERPTTLYRHWGEQRQLLYVGIAFNESARRAKHRQNSPWWPEVRSVTVALFATREHAEAAEAAAIVNESPLYNVAGAPEPQRTQAIALRQARRAEHPRRTAPHADRIASLQSEVQRLTDQLAWTQGSLERWKELHESASRLSDTWRDMYQKLMDDRDVWRQRPIFVVEAPRCECTQVALGETLGITQRFIKRWWRR